MRLSRCLLLYFLVIACAPGCFAVDLLKCSWSSYGPQTGTVSNLLEDRRHPGRWVLLKQDTQRGGLLSISLDNGQTWKTFLDHVQSIYVHPAEGEVFAIRVPDANSSIRELWSTGNSEATFHLQNSESSNQIWGHPSRPHILFRPASASLSVSSDSGRTWSDLGEFPYRIDDYKDWPSHYFNVHDVLASPFDPSIIYVSAELTFYYSHDDEMIPLLLESRNFGRSWHIAEKAEYSFSYDAAFPDRAYMLGDQIKYLSSHGWRSLSQKWGREIIQVPGTPELLYLTGWSGFYVSHDSGGTWRRTDLGLAGGIQVFRPRSMPAGSYFGGTGGAGLYVRNSDDDWKSVAIGESRTEIDSVDGTVGGFLYARARSDYGGFLYRSENGGLTWQNITGLIPIHSAAYGLGSIQAHPDDSRFIVGGVRDRIVVSYDAGQTWRILPMNDVSFVGFHPTNRNVLFFSRDRTVFRSVDGGRSIQKLEAVLKWPVYKVLVDRSNDNVLYFTGGGGVHKSTDGGATAVAINNGLIIQPDSLYDNESFDIVQLPGTNRFLLTMNNSLYRTDNGGASWQQVSVMPDYYEKLYLDDPEGHRIYAVRSSLIESKDGGKTWQDLNAQIDPFLQHRWMWILNSISNPQSSTVFAGTLIGLFRSECP